jgi:hypothetical protein
MLADLILAIGDLPNIRWMSVGAVLPGRLCTTQAVFKQVGKVGVAMTSLAIAFHTFSILVLRWKGPPNFQKYIIAGIWVFVAVVIGIPNIVHRNEAYYGITYRGYWCWILPQYKLEQIATQYFWVWLAALFMIVLYGIMFAIIRRWFNIAHGIHWHNRPLRVRDALDLDSDDDKKIKAVANSMLFYPAVFIFCFLPTTLSRFITYYTNKNVPYQFTLFAITIYGLSGVFNVILFLVTRPKIVVGPSVCPTTREDCGALPIHSRHESRNRLYNDYGSFSTDIECPTTNSKHGSSIQELQSPSRTLHRLRPSYDLQGIGSANGSSSSSPARNAHHRWASSDMPVLDIG